MLDHVANASRELTTYARKRIEWDSNEEHGDANDDTDSFTYSQKSSMA